MSQIASPTTVQSPRPFFMAVNHAYDSVPDQLQAVGLLRMAQGLMLTAIFGLVFVSGVPSAQSTLFSFAGIAFNSGRAMYTVLVASSLLTWLSVGRLLSQGHLRRASQFFVLDLLLITSLIYLIHVPTNAAIVVMVVPLVAAGVLFTRREVIWMGVAITAVVLLNVTLDGSGYSIGRNQLRPKDVTIYVGLVSFVQIVMLSTFAGGRIALLKERQSLIEELQALNQTLEQRVADRTRDLVLAAEVSKEAVSVIDLETLLPRAVKMTRNAFDLYHVGLYTYDETDQTLHLKVAIDDTETLTEHSHETFSLKSPQGVISKAARERQAIVIDDVSASPIFIYDPALPQVKSEVALPMLVSGQLIGVLDLQSKQLQRFTADDLRVFQTLADQIAVSIRNSQLFGEVTAAREDAEQSNQVKSAFLASMSHELRTPLNAIINFTKFVSRGVMGPVNEKQVSTLTNVIEGGEHLLALINDVLDISKIESGSLNLFFQDVHMAEIAATAEKTARSLLADKSVTFTQDIAPNLPTIVGDQQRILQVVLNIVSNACKFTREGEIRMTASIKDDEMLVTISDTGPGIDPEDYDAVFEKFKQTDTGLRQGGGTGLGMPISRSLIEAHGGRLWIEGARGQGATFKFTLPLQAKVDPRIVTMGA